MSESVLESAHGHDELPQQQQGAGEGEGQGEHAAAVAPLGTPTTSSSSSSLHVLPDEVLGLLWEHLGDDVRVKQALRQASRVVRDSVAVQAQISCLSLLMRPGKEQERARKLVAFMRIGHLRSLELSSSSTMGLALAWSFLSTMLETHSGVAAFRGLSELELQVGGQQPRWVSFEGLSACIHLHGLGQPSSQAQSHHSRTPMHPVVSLMQGVGKHCKEVCGALSSHCPRLDSLSLHHISSPPCLQDLRALSSLRSLHLGGSQLQQQLVLPDGLSSLSQLTHLGLSGERLWLFVGEQPQPLDLRPILHLSGLQSLNLSYISVPNLQPVADGCTSLTRLVLGNTLFPTTQLCHLRNLGLQSLTLNFSLRRHGQDELQAAVQDCAALTSLGLLHMECAFSHGPGPVDLRAVSRLAGLRSLRVCFSRCSVAGLEAVACSCSQLTRLEVAGLGTPFNSQALRSLSSLQSLSLDFCWSSGVTEQVQGVVCSLASVTSLTCVELSSEAGSGEAGTSSTLDVSHFARLSLLSSLDLHCASYSEGNVSGAWVGGLLSLGRACSRLAHLRVRAGGLAGAAEGSSKSSSVPGVGGSSNSSSSSNSSGGGGGSGASSSSGPMWPSLQSLGCNVEPGHVADLQLHSAPHLRSCGFNALLSRRGFALERGSPASSPEGGIHGRLLCHAPPLSRGLGPWHMGIVLTWGFYCTGNLCSAVTCIMRCVHTSWGSPVPLDKAGCLTDCPSGFPTCCSTANRLPLPGIVPPPPRCLLP